MKNKSRVFHFSTINSVKMVALKFLILHNERGKKTRRRDHGRFAENAI